MITGVFYKGFRQFADVVVNTDGLSSVRLEGYNFNTVNGVMLSASSTTGLPLTSVSFPRQEAITGSLVNFTKVSQNFIDVQIPSDINVGASFQFIPFNIAGYSTTINRIFESIRFIFGGDDSISYLVDHNFSFIVTEDGDGIVISNEEVVYTSFLVNENMDTIVNEIVMK